MYISMRHMPGNENEIEFSFSSSIFEAGFIWKPLLLS